MAWFGQIPKHCCGGTHILYGTGHSMYGILGNTRTRSGGETVFHSTSHHGRDNGACIVSRISGIHGRASHSTSDIPGHVFPHTSNMPSPPYDRPYRAYGASWHTPSCVCPDGRFRDPAHLLLRSCPRQMRGQRFRSVTSSWRRSL